MNNPISSLKSLGEGHSFCAHDLFTSMANKINKENRPNPEVSLYLNTKFMFKFLGEELEQCGISLELLILLRSNCIVFLDFNTVHVLTQNVVKVFFCFGSIVIC